MGGMRRIRRTKDNSLDTLWEHFFIVSAQYYRKLGFFDLANQHNNLLHASKQGYIDNIPDGPLMRLYAGRYPYT